MAFTPHRSRILPHALPRMHFAGYARLHYHHATIWPDGLPRSLWMHTGSFTPRSRTILPWTLHTFCPLSPHHPALCLKQLSHSFHHLPSLPKHCLPQPHSTAFLLPSWCMYLPPPYAYNSYIPLLPEQRQKAAAFPPLHVTRAHAAEMNLPLYLPQNTVGELFWLSGIFALHFTRQRAPYLRH